MKDTIAKQKSDIDTLQKEKREMRLIDEEWCSIMEAKLDLKGFNSQQTQTDPPKPLAAK